MGTNTFHLLIGEKKGGSFSILYEERVPVRIGMGGINLGIITDEGMARAIKALQGFKATIDQKKISSILAFGTSAIRNASNKVEVIQKLKSATGIETKLITGDQEAEYIYRGVSAALDLGERKSLVMDIGGGSVEFIVCNAHEIFWKQSVEIGGQRLLEKFHQTDPIPREQIENLTVYLAESLSNLFFYLEKHNPVTLVGSSGVFDTLSDIYCIRQGIQSSPPEVPLTIKGFEEIYYDLLKKDRTSRLHIPGMIELRVDMIVVASCLINLILKKHPFQNLRVSNYSLKEGVLASL